MTVLFRVYGRYHRIRKRLLGDLRADVKRTGDGFYVRGNKIIVPVVRRGKVDAIVVVLPDLAGLQVPIPPSGVLGSHVKAGDSLTLLFTGPVFRVNT